MRAAKRTVKYLRAMRSCYGRIRCEWGSFSPVWPGVLNQKYSLLWQLRAGSRSNLLSSTPPPRACRSRSGDAACRFAHPLILGDRPAVPGVWDLRRYAQAFGVRSRAAGFRRGVLRDANICDTSGDDAAQECASTPPSKRCALRAADSRAFWGSHKAARAGVFCRATWAAKIPRVAAVGRTSSQFTR